jgi:sugar/nucleoside kinase (ribokinase family)
MKKVLGIGNSLVDIIVFLRDDNLLDELTLPKGSMQLVDAGRSAKIENITSSLKRYLASGGSAANTIHGLAGLMIHSGFIGAVGKDEMGSFFTEDMNKSGITTHLLTGEMPTGMAISLVSTDGERTFATFLGSAVEIIPEGINNEILEKYDHLHVEGYLVQDHSLFTHAIRMAKQAGLTVSLDLASYNVVHDNREFLNEIISKYVDVVIANESEANSLTGSPNPEEALDLISSLCKTAVVKTGAKGSIIKENNIVYKVDAEPADCIDTTGAGDLYASGYIYGYIQGWAPDKCGRTGSLLASKVIEVPGAKITREGWENIYSRMGLPLRTIRESRR